MNRKTTAVGERCTKLLITKASKNPYTRTAIACCAALFFILPVTGCGSTQQDFNELLHLNTPKPSEAAVWMFNRDPEKRRLGITLFANAPFGGEDVYLKIYRKAVTDIDPLVRAAAVQALGLHGTGNDAPIVATALKDESPLTRLEAAKSLQRLHNETVIPALIETMTSDENSDVKAAAATALGQYPQNRVIDALISTLDDRSLTVNEQARRSLRILTGQDFGNNREKWLTWYHSVDNPFANGKTYRYPVYTRNLSWYEKYTPLGKSEFEKPAPPRGTIEESPRKNKQNNTTTPPKTNDSNDK